MNIAKITLLEVGKDRATIAFEPLIGDSQTTQTVGLNIGDTLTIDAPATFQPPLQGVAVAYQPEGWREAPLDEVLEANEIR